MTPEIFDKIFTSVKFQDNFVETLKLFVLNCALNGKLVPQLEYEENVDHLIAKIEKHNKSITKFQTNNQPELRIPKSWRWVPALFPAASISTKGKQIATKQISDKGSFPVVDQGKVFIRGYSDDSEKVIEVNQPILLFGDHTREVKLIDFDFIVGADGTKLLETIEIDQKFYFYALTWLPLEARGYSRHFKILKKSYIPLPPLIEQRNIVAKVDELLSLIDQWEISFKKEEIIKAELLKTILA